MSRRIVVLLTALLVFTLVLPASAADRSGLAIIVRCGGFTTIGGIVLNRDNTGAGRESFSIVAKDGNGAIIYSGPVESFYVGARITFPPNLTTAYSTAPAANPIIVSLVSAAGNDLPEQVVYAAAGRCDGLPTVEAQTEVPTGITSPSVPVNTLPPSGINPDDEIRAQAGHLVVNTGYLNMRSGDGPEFTIVGRVASGDRLIVLGRNDDFSWWYVKAGELTGWVLTDFVFIRGDLRGVPVVTPVGEIALPRFFLYMSQPLWDSPLLGGTTICTIPGNREYEIVGRTGGLSHVKVLANCDGADVEGWLAVDLGAVRNTGDVFVPVVD